MPEKCTSIAIISTFNYSLIRKINLESNVFEKVFNLACNVLQYKPGAIFLIIFTSLKPSLKIVCLLALRIRSIIFSSLLVLLSTFISEAVVSWDILGAWLTYCWKNVPLKILLSQDITYYYRSHQLEGNQRHCSPVFTFGFHCL